MAKSTSTGETMIRTGCKRELQFMLKSQSEICGGQSLGRTRGSKTHSTSTDAKRPRRVLHSGLKKMRLVTKDEDVVMSDSVEEDEKSDVVDVDDVVMDEDHSREHLEKGTRAVKETVKECSIVIEREIVLACPASFSEFAKVTSRSCHVKLKSGIGYKKPGRRLTRSMLKSECVKSEANVDDDMNLGREAKGSEDSCVSEGNKSEANGCEDHLNAEREAKDSCVAKSSKSKANGDEDHINVEREVKDSQDSCVDADTTLVAYEKEEELHEKNSVNSCLDLDKKAVSDGVDTPLRRLTRSLVKQDSDFEHPDLENNIEPSDLGKVDVNANDVEMDDFQSPSITTPNKRGRPRKFMRNFPAKLKELFDSRILEGLTV